MKQSAQDDLLDALVQWSRNGLDVEQIEHSLDPDLQTGHRVWIRTRPLVAMNVLVVLHGSSCGCDLLTWDLLLQG